MAQLDSRSSIIKGKQIYIGESSCGGQWQSDTSGIPVQANHIFDPSCNTWQVGAKVCIFRVPNPIMVGNREAYLPSTVSLGPYHHNSNDRVSTMNQHKQEAVRRMVSRIKRDGVSLMKRIQNMERDIREYYEERLNCDGETLCCMMVYDACFILEFFRCASRTKDENPQGWFSLVFQNKDFKNCMHSAILSDIMKLENQIPLSVLIEILRLEFDHPEPELAAMLSNSELFKGFPFNASLSVEDVNDVAKSKLKDDGVKSKLREYIEKYPCYHLLDLYRIVIKDLLTPENSESYIARRLGYVQIACPPNHSSFTSDAAESLVDKRYSPCAEELQNAGIIFKVGQVRFRRRKWVNSKLSLPQITVNYMTETLLRNLMAYEECQRCSWNPEPTVISYYIRLLDNLINSDKDVSALRDSKVIKSLLGSDQDIVSIFNHLQIGITVDPLDRRTTPTINGREPIHEYENIMIELKEHYDAKWNVWLAQFMKEKCSNPWYAISFLAATGLLVMTVIQTVYTVK
ncbi:hypothetical protein SUGI_0693590 [Cryptomeria japonica]|uniref:UPF0481 protein At3g47200-like n=1 Tax=Cryptomeria japonica TaxID=3369 RepID=UPI002414C2C1|nr:UPF0481 protein At3g47200-like [Cryptomeria japonica]GLJ34484.1 hypothetical protein SUGI_0693590 [Cryptomeria japonica]